MKIEKITPQIAALYLGQKFDAVWVTGPLKGHIVKTSDKGITPTLVSLMYPDNIANQLEITPHLRRLDSMTEDEAREVYFIYEGTNWNPREYVEEEDEDRGCLRYWWNHQEEYYTDESFFCVGRPAVWLYLLQNGFDLFGLIDAELAKEIVAQ